MNKIFNKYIFFILAFICVSFSIFFALKTAWIIFLLLFYISAYFLIFKKQNIFTNRIEKLFIFWMFFYPFLNIFILYIIQYDIILHSYRIFNTIEHIGLIGSLSFIIYGFLIKLFSKLSDWERFLVLFSIIISIGIGIEVLQYMVRVFIFESASTYKMAEYYSDTIFDTITNIISGIFWSLLVAYRK